MGILLKGRASSQMLRQGLPKLGQPMQQIEDGDVAQLYGALLLGNAFRRWS